jgi:hypothetical protein
MESGGLGWAGAPPAPAPVALGAGARLVALEQSTYRARADDRWEEGHRLRVGWHPEHCLALSVGAA